MYNYDWTIMLWAPKIRYFFIEKKPQKTKTFCFCTRGGRMQNLKMWKKTSACHQMFLFLRGEFGVAASWCGPTHSHTHPSHPATPPHYTLQWPQRAPSWRVCWREERRARDELQRLLKYPSLDNCQLMVWKQLAHCNGNLVPVNHSIPLKAFLALLRVSLPHFAPHGWKCRWSSGINLSAVCRSSVPPTPITPLFGNNRWFR